LTDAVYNSASKEHLARIQVIRYNQHFLSYFVWNFHSIWLLFLQKWVFFQKWTPCRSVPTSCSQYHYALLWSSYAKGDDTLRTTHNCQPLHC